MKELVKMLEDLQEKYGIDDKDIEPIAKKIGEVAGPEAAKELEDGEGEEGAQGGEFDDLEEEEA